MRQLPAKIRNVTAVPRWLRGVAGTSGVLACVAAALPWTQLAGVPRRSSDGVSYAYGFVYAPSRWYVSGLQWDNARPQIGLLVAMTAVGAATAVIAVTKPDIRFLTVLLVTAPVFAVWPWAMPSGPHLAPAAGYWVGVLSLVLAVIALIALVGGALRRRARAAV